MGNTSVFVRGRGLRQLGGGTKAECRFGTTTVPATIESDRAARCIAPAAAVPVVVPLSLSLDPAGANNWMQPVRFWFYNATLKALSPSSGPAQAAGFALSGVGCFASGAASAEWGAISTPLVEEMKADGSRIAARLAQVTRTMSPPLVPTVVARAYRANASGLPRASGGSGGGSLLLLGAADCSMAALRLGGAAGQLLHKSSTEGLKARSLALHPMAR